jgi:hypothetical protein
MMNKLRIPFLVMMLLPLLLLEGQERCGTGNMEPKFIGRLDQPFWRLSVMTGSWAKSGLGLVAVPKFFCDSSLSFPYIKRPYPKEYLFSDHVILVRTLGGWPKGNSGEKQRFRNIRDADIVYRAGDGQLKTRMNLLKNRLQPYIDAGYSENITVVLDNIPYVFTSMPTMHKYGQASPPDNLKEWTWFIKEMANQLVSWYGMEKVKSWRFRLGTEWDNEDRFQGSAREYYALYKATARAFMDVLGEDVNLGPFNANSNAMFSTIPSHPVGIDYFKLVSYIKKKDLPLSYTAFSDYSIPYFDHPNQKMAAEPLAIVDRMTKIFTKMDSLYPSNKEINEYGVLSNEFKKPTVEPGARSAAINFYVFFSLWEKGLSQIAHWNYSEDWYNYRCRGEKGRWYSFMDGRIWSNLILEHMVGSQVYSYYKTCDDKTIIQVLLFEKETNLYLVASAINPDRTLNENQPVTIVLPENIEIDTLAGVSYTGISEEECLYRTIYEDMKAEGNLAESYNRAVVTLAGIREMAKDYPQAKEMIAKNYDRYLDQMKSSLTLKKEGKPLVLGEDEKTIKFSIRPTSCSVFCLKKKRIP